MIHSRLRHIWTAGLVMAVAGTAMADDLLPPPFQVEGLVSYREPYRVEGLTRYRDWDATPGALDGPFVVVDLGGAQDRLLPVEEWPDALATIIGTKGHLVAIRHDIVRTCEHPCGPTEYEECHFSALYRPETPVAAIGTPLIAIEGRHDLEGFRLSAGKPAAGGSLALASGLSSTLWGDRAQFGFQDLSDDGRRLTLASDRPQLDGTRWQECRAEDHGPVQRLQCGSSNGALLSEGRPILVSIEEGVISVFATFSVRDQSYIVAQRGYTTGLLARTAQGWQGLVRTAGHALTCG